MREIIATTVAGDPDTYSEPFLGQPNDRFIIYIYYLARHTEINRSKQTAVICRDNLSETNILLNEVFLFKAGSANFL